MISKKTAAQVSLAGSDWVQPALTRSGTTSASARKGDPDAMVEFELVKVQLPLSPGSVVKRWPVPAFIFPADWRPASDHSAPPAAPASSIDDRAPASRRLALGNKTAAIALEARLRSAGIAVR